MELTKNYFGKISRGIGILAKLTHEHYKLVNSHCSYVLCLYLGLCLSDFA